MITSRLTIPTLLLFLLALKPCWAQEPDSADVAFFETHIRPLFLQHCAECHGDEEQAGGLRLDRPAGIQAGGDSGPLFVPGKPAESLLIAAVKRVEINLQMPPPPAPSLKRDEIQRLTEWIERGADLPGDAAAMKPASENHSDANKAQNINEDPRAKHWAFQTPARPEIPSVSPTHRPHIRGAIDRFIAHQWEQQGLIGNEPATRVDWIRRVTFDITGLPPTPDEVAAYLSDESPYADERLVDRLLASPQYGVRWGRHWLDTVRYADSNGLDENIAHGNAWRYRDYVVRSWNEDKPFDYFVQQQIAGDLLPHRNEAELFDHRTALGYLVLGPKVLAEVDERKMEMDIVDEQIDTMGKSLLGITLGCARCHDHKFDPIPTVDYYGLAGIFKSTRTMESFTKIAKWNENSIATLEDRERKIAMEQQVAVLKERVETRRKEALAQLATQRQASGAAKSEKDAEMDLPPEVQQELTKLREEAAALEKSIPELPTAMGVIDGSIADVPLHVRGSHLALGRVVPRQFPQVLAKSQPTFPGDSSGRLQLAQWLTSRDQPLTARVIVNRLWRWHFGKGIVSSVDNFGLLGENPTHPELLDWLAVELIESGWSIKHIQRLILLSGVYRQSTQTTQLHQERDPENRWLSRMSIRRLEAEAVRDAILAVSGTIDLQKGTSLLHVKNREFLFDHTSIDRTKYDSQLRSIYLPVILLFFIRDLRVIRG